MSKKDEIKAFNDWLATRPPSVQRVGKNYPAYLQYIVKQGAPYSISGPGTLVQIDSYTESGDVGVIVMAQQKTMAAIQREKELCVEHGTKYADVKEANVKAWIDPKWIEPISN